MARIVVVVAALVALHASTASAACIDGVERHGHLYIGASLHRSVELAGALRATRPGCDDAIAIGPDGRRSNPPPPDREIRLRRIRGVHPDVALGSSRRRAYVAPGYLTELSSHPLHRGLWRRRDLPRPRRCREVVVSGRLKWQPGFATLFRVAGRNLALRADARYLGRRRHGLPYVATGDRITARGCPVRREGRRSLEVSLIRQRRGA